MWKNAEIFEKYKNIRNLFGYGYGNFWVFGFELGIGYRGENKNYNTSQITVILEIFFYKRVPQNFY